MNILFGSKEIDAIRQQSNLTVLELDTIQITPDHVPEPAWCILSEIPLHELADLERKVKMHQDLMHFYRTRQWQECRSIIDLLRGSWNHELDSFYDEIESRIDALAMTDVEEDWDGIYRPWRKARS